ncbi:MAG: hypothetical protein M1817_004359 [Caeruleum heppii]|nr:MAG: hypothetical protein M1817_004359 [Caeruleum heppii]
MRPSRASDSAEAVKLTPNTRRPSKALKGRRVHACDRCPNLVYTRAEHLRRHQLNHNAEARYKCGVSGCTRGFQRRDLLDRHMERQHRLPSKAPRTPSMSQRESLSASTTPSTQSYGTPGTVMDSPVTEPAMFNHGGPTFGVHDMGTAINFTGCHSGASSPARQITNSNLLSPLSIPGSSAPPSGALVPELAYGNSDEYALFSATSSCNSAISPNSPLAFPQMYGFHPRSRADSSVSAPDAAYCTSNSTLSGCPTTSWPTEELMPPQTQVLCSPYEGTFVLPAVGTPTLGHFARGRADGITANAVHVPVPKLGRQPAFGLRDLLREWHLKAPSADMFTMRKIEAYLDCYWRFFAPSVPIVHRATFSTDGPALLVAAMATLGAYHQGTSEGRLAAVTMYESCREALQDHSPYNTPTQISDMQALTLIEFFGTHKDPRSIRARPSMPFLAMWSKLYRDRLDTSTVSPTRLRTESSPDQLRSEWHQWIDVESRRRVVLAGFILCAQQDILFELHTTPSAGLPLSSSAAVWESTSAAEWLECSRQSTNATLGYVSDASPGVVRAVGDRYPTDPFESAIMLAHEVLAHRSRPGDKMMWLERESQRVSLSPPDRSRKTHESSVTRQAYLLAMHTPIRALLGVVGESWVLGRKIKSHAEHKDNKIQLRRWADGVEGKKAVWHASQLLRLVFSDLLSDGEARPATATGVHEYWCRYIAALVCWAYTFGQVFATGSSMSRASSQRISGHEVVGLQLFLATFDVPSWREVGGMGDMRWPSIGLLACVRQTIADENSALLREANGILDTLCEGKIARMVF